MLIDMVGYECVAHACSVDVMLFPLFQPCIARMVSERDEVIRFCLDFLFLVEVKNSLVTV